MKISLASLCLFSTILTTGLFADSSVSFENPAPAGISETKPEFLFFKKGTITRIGKNRLALEFDLAGKMPNNLSDQRIAFHIIFDIDNDKGTGTEAITFPGFGKDISAYIIKSEGTNRFEGSSSEVVHQGRKLDIRVTKLKVGDDKVSCDLASELFGKWPSLRVYLMSYRATFDRGMETGKTWVDQLPRKGAMRLESE